MLRIFTLLTMLVTALPARRAAAEEDDQPKPAPVTRVEMKAALDRLKDREPRLPFPPLTENESAAVAEHKLVNNSRMRKLYLPEELSGGGFRREPDPRMTFDYPFATMLFWITSRVNNCHYCLGHQENKLLTAGVGEDRIAALDGDWRQFTPAEQAAFAFARKLTYEPHTVGNRDLESLRPHYGDLQILELIFLVSRYNATNRWTDSLGIPQEQHRVLLTPTSERYREEFSRVAPIEAAEPKGTACPAVAARRPKLESRAEVEAAIEAARRRTPRVPLMDVEAASASPSAPPQASSNWVRLLANFPQQGEAWIATLHAAGEKGRLAPRVKAEIAWTAARHDRAWYALAHAERRLRELEWSDEEIHALDSPGEELPVAERAAIDFARKLTTSPQLIVDGDIAALRQRFSDPEVAEIVFHVTLAAFFNRITEASHLPVEAGRAG